MRPRLLDLYCKAGGCARGYTEAGFEVVGVDIEPQKNYLKSGAVEFVQADALEHVAKHGHEFDVIHASPPCQGHTRAKALWGRTYGTEGLLAETRSAMEASGKTWVIENVPGSPMRDPCVLCGTLFGLKVIRHRWFESNHLLLAPSSRCQHPPRGSVVKTGRPVNEGQYMAVAGHFSSVDMASKAMGIDWMTRAELAQAIPPAYTKFIGQQLMRIICHEPA